MTIRTEIERFLPSPRYFVSWDIAAEHLCRNDKGNLQHNWRIHRAIQRGFLSVRFIDQGGDKTTSPVVLSRGPRLIVAMYSS